MRLSFYVDPHIVVNAVLPPNSLCSHYSFQGRGSRIDFHRNVRRGVGNFPLALHARIPSVEWLTEKKSSSQGI